MAKIKIKSPVVQLDGDHLELIKNELSLPYLDVDLKYYDLGMESRDMFTSIRQDRP